MFLTFDTPLDFCDICDEDKIWFTVFAAPCGHRFCSDCLTTLFGLCTTDEEVYPPRCCTQTIPLDRVNGGLSRELVETFRAKSIEWEIKDRTYCYNTKCAKFIPPEGIVGNTATCQQCYRRTCPSCKTAAHTGDCPRDAAMEQLLEIAEREQWQRCYSCTRLVVLAHGCNHVSCPCGAEFCYVCGSRWLPRSCECGVWNEHNLTGRPRPADLPPDRRRRLLRIRYTVLDHAMSDNLPVPSSNTFPHAGHFLHRNRKSLGIDWLQILSVCVLFDRNRNLLRINQLQIIPVTVKPLLRIYLENTEWSTDQQEQWSTDQKEQHEPSQFNPLNHKYQPQFTKEDKSHSNRKGKKDETDTNNTGQSQSSRYNQTHSDQMPDDQKYHR
ncbi:hypothetical protein D6D26_10129 [Aureobasidium pullulans]|nr:hypothetical protein D6D26_10129 [Aureobasidium pullulans]